MYLQNRNRDTDEYICKTGIETQIWKQTYGQQGRGKGDGMNWEIEFDIIYYQYFV